MGSFDSNRFTKHVYTAANSKFAPKKRVFQKQKQHSERNEFLEKILSSLEEIIQIDDKQKKNKQTVDVINLLKDHIQELNEAKKHQDLTRSITKILKK
jgi:hypothetical protein